MICDESTGYLQQFVTSTKVGSMVGSLPSELGLMTNLQVLSISNSDKLMGTIPKELENIKGLIRLILESNSLDGTIPKEITTFNRRTYPIPWARCVDCIQYFHVSSILPVFVCSFHFVSYIYSHASQSGHE
jgi:Leucine-rich repeat (LRR) protein